MQRVQAVSHADAKVRLAIGCEFGLELLEFLAQQVPAGLHDSMIGGVEFGAKLVVNRLKLKKRNLHISLGLKEFLVIPVIIRFVVEIRRKDQADRSR